MGAAASFGEIPDYIDEDMCKSLIGELKWSIRINSNTYLISLIGQTYDENLFYGLAVNGVIPRQKFLEAVQARTDVFLTHGRNAIIRYINIIFMIFVCVLFDTYQIGVRRTVWITISESR